MRVLHQPLNEWAARAIVTAIRDRRVTAAAVMDACQARIAAREPQVKAWSFLDADLARERAQQADKRQAAGFPLMPLHGLARLADATTTLNDVSSHEQA